MAENYNRSKYMLAHVANILKVKGASVNAARKDVLETSSSILKRSLSKSQESLPKLPVPPLKQTADRLLKSMKPLATEDEFRNAEKLLAKFLQSDNVSHRLQNLLEERAANNENWLSEWWLNVAYLEFRDPVLINVSPGILLPKQNIKGKEGQIRTAAKAISGTVDYLERLKSGTIPTDKLGNSPLCMRQYYRMLCTCRIPGEKRDRVVTGDDLSTPSKHVTVIHNNHIFSVPVYGSHGYPLSLNQIIDQLKLVVKDSTTKAPPLGILTTDNRDNWVRAYKELNKDKKNREYLDSIHRSIAVICLDSSVSNNSDDIPTAHLIQANNGGGSNINTANRWFDKTIQLLVGVDGFFGATYEHSTAEGPPIISLLDHITTNYMEKDSTSDAPVQIVQPPCRLDFNLTHQVQAQIEASMERADLLITDLDMTAYLFEGFGKNFIKSHKLSPDAFIQISIQLAYYKLYGHSSATYESGSLRKFALGRTETIRSCSQQSHAYCQSMEGRETSAADRVALLQDAIQAHKEYTNAVLIGKGIDRHLLGLKLTAFENGLDLPDLFRDPLFESSSTWKISTSQVASRAGGLLAFGPVVPDGYGVCYNPMDDSIFFGISAWNSCPSTDSRKFKESLKDALSETYALLLQTNGASL